MENKGLILPYVEIKIGITEDGSTIYDTTNHKVEYLKYGNWFDLSVDTTGQTVLSIQMTPQKSKWQSITEQYGASGNHKISHVLLN